MSCRNSDGFDVFFFSSFIAVIPELQFTSASHYFALTQKWKLISFYDNLMHERTTGSFTFVNTFKLSIQGAVYISIKYK